MTQPFDMDLARTNPVAFHRAFDAWNAESLAWQREQRAFRDYLHAAVRTALDAGHVGTLLGYRAPDGSYHHAIAADSEAYWAMANRLCKRFGEEWYANMSNVRGWAICESNAPRT